MMSIQRLLSLMAAAVIVLASATNSARAQWSVSYVNPSAYGRSVGWSVSGSQVVGTIGNHAGLYNTSTQTWTDLNPSGSGVTSEARAVAAGEQVGKYNDSSGDRACYWLGTASSCVSLHPQAASNSCAYGAWGNVQVGQASVGNGNDACMWRGTAQSWVNLHPNGATSSCAYGAYGDQQFGEANFSGTICGGYWTGSASSWVSLNPTGCGYSSVRDGDGTRSVGFAVLGNRSQALLWQGGGANDYINLNPGANTSSYAFAMCGNYQVGHAFIGGGDHAGVWMGSAQSWFDLHTLLPASTYSSSSAYGVDIVNGNLVVVGTAWNNTLQRNEVVVWSQPVPEPSSVLVLSCGIGAAVGLLRKRKSARS